MNRIGKYAEENFNGDVNKAIEYMVEYRKDHPEEFKDFGRDMPKEQEDFF